MDYKHIDQLLEKYWAGESNLAEEAQLRDYFQSPEVAPRHQAFTPLFQVFSDHQDLEVAADFDDRLLTRIAAEEAQATPALPPRRARVRRLWLRVTQVAAVTLLLLGLWFWMPTGSNQKLAQLNDTEVAEAKLAYEQAKAALLLLSTKMNKGTETAATGMNQLEKSTQIIK